LHWYDQTLVILEILQQVLHLNMTRKPVVACWVPGYADLPGNEVANAAVKEAPLVGNLSSVQALANDVHFFLHHTVLF
jgi:hypothetical protein